MSEIKIISKTKVPWGGCAICGRICVKCSNYFDKNGILINKNIKHIEDEFDYGCVLTIVANSSANKIRLEIKNSKTEKQKIRAWSKILMF